MQKFYYRTPNYSVAHNAKAGCTSMACAIIRTYYPELEAKVREQSDNGIGDWQETPLWQLYCPKEFTPTAPVVLLVRQPLLRLKSALVETDLTDVQAVVNAIQNNEQWKFPHLSDAHALRENPHFLKQSSYINGETHLFRFPSHLPEAITFLGLDGNFPYLNQADREINIPQILLARINQYYAQDFNLYSNITAPNTIINNTMPLR
jgi:hypothetical protein